MPNFKKHAAVGASVGLGLVAIANLIQQNNRGKTDPYYKFDWSELIAKSLAGASIGAFCGVLPDLLEPATCPQHRKFFHSIAAASMIGYGMHSANKGKLSENEKQLVNLMGFSYLSHLLLDGNTPYGLPLVA
jgi:membrane-bound metal-dependent hydrolase YbcI (DUF457 family)